MSERRPIRSDTGARARRPPPAPKRPLPDPEPVTVPAWKSASWILALLLVMGLGWFGWSRVSRIGVEHVTVDGAIVADANQIQRVARIDRDTLLLAVAPTMVSDRVRRHPWVEDASTRRLPDGTVAIRVHERTPVLLVLSAAGRPAYYIDRTGHRMPFVPGHSFAVPLLRGLEEPFHPVRPVEDPVILALASVLPDLDVAVDALVSEFRVDADGGLDLVTTPGSSGRPVTVRLGKDRFVERLDRLKAFWDQAVLTRPGVRFALVDLRFEGQIITRESS